MKKLFSIIAAALFATSMFAAQATITPGTNGYDDNTVNGKAAVKVGTSSKGGDLTVTVGAGATSLSLYAVAWKGVTGLVLNITAPEGVTITPNSITLNPNDAISGSDKAFTIDDVSGYKYNFTISGATAETAFKFETASAKRFVMWDAVYATGSEPVTLEPVIAGDANFISSATVTITAEDNCEIYYTDDGSEPMLLAGEVSGNTKIYTAPFTVNETTTIKAFAVNLSTEVSSNVVEKTFTKVAQYDVAEAIAAGLNKGDVIVLRGVVTNMAAKGSNFATYGSLKIYVKDATGAAGEFQLFNCMSLEEGKFTATTPAYDAASTQWADFTSVTDANGNELSVGDTVFAFGKYELYNEVYELQQGCYLLDIIPGEGVPAQTIDITVNEGVLFNSGLIEEDTYFWQVQAQNDDYYVSLAYVGTSDAVAGTYTENDLSASYSVIFDADDNKITMASANITVTVNADETIDVVGTFVGSDGNTYNLNLHYAEPKAETTVTVNINNATIEEDEGLIGVMGEDATGLWVQLFIETETLEGSYTEEDLANNTSIWYDDENYTRVYTAEFEVTANADGSYTLVGDFLCYDNTLYKITMTVPAETPGTAINNVEAVKSNVVKAIENGQLFININGVKYNVNGAIVK